jgi:SAM-dependent methyltransferase
MDGTTTSGEVAARIRRECFRDHEAMLLSLRGADWAKMPAQQREQIVEMGFLYWRARGFPHYCLSPETRRAEFLRLVRYDTSTTFVGSELRGSPTGLSLANHFHPQMWSVPMPGVRSPVDRFFDDETLRKVIRKALRFAPERRALNASNLRRFLQTYSRTARVANFRATAAKAIYERYSGVGERILDFSSGYGGRLLGCLTLPREYFGLDPCRAQVKGLRRMLADLAALVAVPGRATIEQACAEDLLPTLATHSYSLVFSSPPYFNNECYSTERTQSYLKFPSYPQWIAGFLRPILSEAHRILEPGGYCILNIANVNGFELADAAFEIGRRNFIHVATCELRLSQRPYLRTSDCKMHRLEPIFIFRKRRPRAHPIRGGTSRTKLRRPTDIV